MQNTKGSALLTALFIMTLVAIVATAMSMRLQMDIYRTQLMLNQDKLYLASQAVTFWGIGELSNPKQEFRKASSHGMVARYPDTMAKLIPALKIQGALYDLQARFNVNNLNEKRYIPNFLFILDELYPDMKTMDKFNLITALTRWIGAFDLGRGKDPIAEFYLSQKPPYLPANQAMYSISELRMVKGVSAKQYSTLEPHLIALPKTSAINFNTASKTILRSLGNGLKDNQIEELIQARKEKGIKNLREVSELLKKFGISPEQITLQSEFFMVVADVTSNENHQRVTTLLQRERSKKGLITVGVIGSVSQSI